MTRGNVHDVVRWFAGCGDRYVAANLSHVDVQRLAVDRDYGLKLFFFYWAFERYGAPRAYRVAAVKAVSSLNGSQAELGDLFRKFCAGKIWKGGLPILDPNIGDVDIREIVRLVEDGDLRQAFHKLALKGMGHKLRAFFLRDLVTLFKAEPKLGHDKEAYLLCQPIDVWVRYAFQELCAARTVAIIQVPAANYRLSRDDLAGASGIIELSIEAGVSPLKVNQGIWYFSANAVADEARLRKLINSGEKEKFEEELLLMKGFLPTRPMWG